MSSKKRKYTKKNQEYWSSLGKRNDTDQGDKVEKSRLLQNDFTPDLIGDPLYVSESSRATNPNGRTRTRSNKITKTTTKDRFSNIDEGILPWKYSKDYVDVTDAIELCQKAYFNIPVFRSTIDLLSEFANSKLYLNGGSRSSRKFIEAWFKKIKIHDLKEQFFREYYRSGNVFFYKMESKLAIKNITTFDISESSVRKKIPFKYVILNPSDVVVGGQLNFGEHIYAKILTPFEINRLKNPKTEQDKKIFNSLKPEIQKQLKNRSGVSTTADEILVELDQELINVVFYKKQDYEPLAIPLGYSVLDDINKKIELKKIDQAIVRSIENVILLITMGDEPEKGGINDKNIGAMRELFQNKSVGRVLVSDYTTKGDWLLPDLKKVMGKEKYEVLNKDIEDGLGNILLGESKYSDTEFKLRIFFERLEEARERFLIDFLKPEIKRVCDQMGFRDIPVPKFSKKDVIATESLQKLTTRMMELGVLTPEQGIDIVHKGEFPQPDDMRSAQAKYKEDREKGYYMPMVSSNVIYEMENEDVEVVENNAKKPVDKNGQKRGVENPKSRKPATTSGPSGGRPMGSSANYAVSNIYAVTDRIKQLESSANKMYKEKIDKKTLTEKQKKTISDLCLAVVVNDEMNKWEESLSNIISDSTNLMNMSTKPEILSLAGEHGLDDYSAALLYHSSKLV